MEILASALVYSALLTGFVGLIALVKPLPFLCLGRRLGGAAVLGTGVLFALAGLALPTGEARATSQSSHLDGFMPAWQFAEVHSIRVEAPPARVFRAIQEVTADEIRLFRTLTWLRHPRGPWTERGESLLAPPVRRPILAVALRSGFVALTEDAAREIVVGAIVCCSAADSARLVARFRSEGAESFTRLADPGVAKAGMNFLLEEERGGTRLTTETRVYATDDAARRRFATYWRVIYPGSALIRRMWLRAIKVRAEADR